MSVLTPEAMLTTERLPGRSPPEIAALNLDLVRALPDCEFGTEAYYKAIAEFHDRSSKRCAEMLPLRASRGRL
jgi:hypothetical protein